MIVVKSSKQNIPANKLTALKPNRYKIKAECRNSVFSCGSSVTKLVIDSF